MKGKKKTLAKQDVNQLAIQLQMICLVQYRTKPMEETWINLETVSVQILRALLRQLKSIFTDNRKDIWNWYSLNLS